MKSIATTILILAAALAVTACAVRPAADVCQSDCRLTVSLPEDPAQAPRISTEAMHLAGGNPIDIELTGGPVENRATVLRFHRPGGQHEDAGTPFTGSNGRPLYRVNLRSGKNRLTLRPYEDGACRPPNGCKYDIINVGNRERPTLDPWIIIHQ